MNSKNALTISIAVLSVMPSLVFSANYFIATDGSSQGIGTIKAPFSSFKEACNVAKAGDTIFLRAGTYTNPDYGNGDLNNKSMPDIDCSGSAKAPIYIKPYKTEKVKFAYDSFNGIRLRGNYLVFSGFEIEGVAQKISYEAALADWWVGSNYYNGNGIVINGHHVTVKDNVVHDTTGSAIYLYEGGDYATISDNIIYNAAWWSTKGTTAIGLVNAKNSNSSTAKSVIQVLRNLVFTSESRIFSRVPTKGFADLKIDEGSSTLAQVNDGDYTGRYLIKDNFYLFNGKGISVSGTNKVDIQNNTLYMNGSTISGKFTGLRLDNVKDGVVSNNSVVVSNQDLALSVKGELGVSLKANYLQGGDNIADLPSGVTLVSQVFTEPEKLNFASAIKGKQVGASLATWKKLKQKADMLKLQIKPTEWNVDYVAQTKSVVDSIPTGSIVDFSQWDRKVLITFPEGITFGGHSNFELRIDTPYER
jgi:hypothetical protein